MNDMPFYYGTSGRILRYDDLLREAADARLARLAAPHQRSLAGRIISAVGDFLISFGVSLKLRSKQDASQPVVLYFQAGQRIEL